MTKRVFTQVFVAVGAIIEREGKFLLVQEYKKAVMGADGGKWNQPAGWLDVGEDPIEAVKREVKEETGLDFEPTALVGIYSLHRKDLAKSLGVTPHALKLIFRGNVTGGEVVPGTNEILEARWFSLEEIEAMTLDTLRDLDIKQEVKDYLSGKSYFLEMIRHTVSGQ